MSLLSKTRYRGEVTFANINLLGKCNVNCYFCLGKDLKKEFSKYDSMGVHFHLWDGFDKFIGACKMAKIRQIYITGQNTDSLLYRNLDELIHYLQGLGFYVGLRTNGFLALDKMDSINRCNTCYGDAVSYSIHTMNPNTQKKMLGTEQVPNWRSILNKTTAPMRVACVLTRHNVKELRSIIRACSSFRNVRYFQVRRVSTDTRVKALLPDIKLFEEVEKDFARVYPKMDEHSTANSYQVGGLEVSFWRTVKTTANSFNYFTNGVFSDKYFIIEGYAKAAGISLAKLK